jgi:hypothetical protein
MKNSFKIGVVIVTLVFFIVGGYFYIFMSPENDASLPKNSTHDNSEGNWIRENSPETPDNHSFSRNVKLSDGSFENQLINISRYMTELEPEEWVATQIDLNDVLVMTHEWSEYNGYKHLSITSKTISDDARIDYFFKDNEVSSFTFQPLHALNIPENSGFYLKVIDESLSN